MERPGADWPTQRDEARYRRSTERDALAEELAVAADGADACEELFVAQVLGSKGVSVKSVVQKGLGDQARLVMVFHPVLESRFRAATAELAALAVLRAPPRAIRVIEEEFG